MYLRLCYSYFVGIGFAFLFIFILKYFILILDICKKYGKFIRDKTFIVYLDIFISLLVMTRIIPDNNKKKLCI